MRTKNWARKSKMITGFWDSTMHLKIAHRTQYQYENAVPYALQELRLVPVTSPGQTVLSWNTTIEGAQAEVTFTDQHNNHAVLLSFEPDRKTIEIFSEGEVETHDTGGIIGRHTGFAPLWYFLRPSELTKPGPRIRALAKALPNDFADDVTRLHALSALIIQAVAYETGKTQAETSAEDAMELACGVCQDHAHIFISTARLMGFPARYVSGYLMMDGVVDQEASHAWAEAHVEGLGWVGFDVSNGISPDERYIRVATGLDYKQAAPISGIIFGGHEESMSVSLQVQQ